MNGCCHNSIYDVLTAGCAQWRMVQTVRHPALLLQEALRFTAVLGCATALIAAGRFLPY
jgi:hypothetical protein